MATVPEKGKGPYCKDKIIPSIIANGQINGQGASFDVYTTKNKTIESILVNSGGGGYQIGESLTIPGNLLCGSSPEDDVTFVVTGISSPTEITPVIPQLPPPLPTGIGGVNAGAAVGVDANLSLIHI